MSSINNTPYEYLVAHVQQSLRTILFLEKSGTPTFYKITILTATSATSINISCLLAQVCYYCEAVAQLPKASRAKAVISVPSGNFGNLTAGLIAKALGLPVKRFIAATNTNDTVPRYLKTGQWEPH